MADLLVPTYEQIATILTKLATNYSNLASTFYDIFYSTTPEDIDIQLYNEAGELVTYTIPNRAKDLQNLLSGNTVPEGNVEGTKGTLYQDLTSGDLYIKETPDGTEGWNRFSTEDFLKSIFIQGNGNPNGNVSAEKGVLYIDTSSASLYIKTTETGKEGWQLISATVSAFADVNLSNLSPEGEGKFLHPDLSNLSPQGELSISQMTANRSLSNLDEDGERKFTIKEDVTNKVTTISASSTDIQYPSAKCVYDNVNKFLTDRTLSMTGAVTGTANFNLGEDDFISIATTGKSKTLSLSGDVSGSAILNTGNTNSVNIYVNIVNNTKMDGQWVIVDQALTGYTSVGNHIISLGTYLPNNSYTYECLFRYSISRKGESATNSTYAVRIPDSNGVIFLYDNTDGGNSSGDVETEGGQFTGIIGSERQICVTIGTKALTSSSLALIAYRRIGTNS